MRENHRFEKIIDIIEAVIEIIAHIVFYFGRKWIRFVKKYKRLHLFGALLGAVFFFSWQFFVRGPVPTDEIVSIDEGQSVGEVSTMLQGAGIVRSTSLFGIVARFTNSDTKLISGVYDFGTHRNNLFWVLRRLRTGDYQTTRVKVLIPESSTVVEMSQILSEKLVDFEVREFLITALPLEGKLYPDTYFFLLDTSYTTVIEKMRENFDRRTKDIQIKVKQNMRELLPEIDDLDEITFDDIIIMASIIEKEAWKEEDRYKISGVLWHRLAIDMKLQVDAVFLYDGRFDGRNTYTLTLDDLKDDSPYNTYTRNGLPPTPICNPSITSIMAAADPVASLNLFYLADLQGNTYYSETFEEHRSKRPLLNQ